jgi:hypothetical protein
METVKEFMQSFFAERAAIDRAAEARGAPFVEKYYTTEYLAASRRVHDKAHTYGKLIPSVILQVNISDSTATVITSEPSYETSERHIYKLRKATKGWQIDQRGDECYLCDGTGVFQGETCNKCDGKKWRYSSASEGRD